MDKIITINLGGYAIKMEEDAYEALKPYIRQIELTFANTENGKEIINDIEARIAEMLMERTEGKVSATIEDVEYVKKTMGNPGEFDENADEEKPREHAIPNETVRKRLYRDTDNKILGGVGSGISAYFNIDPTIIRLIWIVLIFFFGTGVLLYFILWLIVPEAVTTAQKLEMRGEAPTLDNIINRVKSEAGKVEQNLKAQNFGQKIGDIFSSLSPVFLAIFKAFAIIIGLFVLIVLSAILIALITAKSGLVINNGAVSMQHIPNFFEAHWEFLTFKILVGLFVCIPLFTILAGLLKFAFNTNVNFRPVRRILGWVWALTIPFLIYFIYKGFNNFKSYETITSEKTEMVTSPLLIKTSFNDDVDLFELIDVRISSSPDSLIHINITQSANGKNPSQARDMARKNEATYTLIRNELTLITGDYFQKTGLYRRQKVDFEIQVPDGLTFTLDKSIQQTGVDVEGNNLNYYASGENDELGALIYLNSALYCPTCPDSIPPGSSGLHNYLNFNRIDAEGLVDLEIRKGNTYSIQKSGPANVIKHLDIWQSGNELNIEMDDDYINLRTRPRIIITMPELSSLKLSGGVHCEAGDFGGDELFVDLSGASKAKLDGHYGHMIIEISGVSRLDISGDTKIISNNLSGSSHLDAQKLSMESVQVNLSGVSEAILGPSKSISGSLSGASKLQYTGNSTLQVNSSGVSKIEKIP